MRWHILPIKYNPLRCVLYVNWKGIIHTLVAMDSKRLSEPMLNIKTSGRTWKQICLYIYLINLHNSYSEQVKTFKVRDQCEDKIKIKFIESYTIIFTFIAFKSKQWFWFVLLVFSRLWTSTCSLCKSWNSRCSSWNSRC